MLFGELLGAGTHQDFVFWFGRGFDASLGKVFGRVDRWHRAHFAAAVVGCAAKERRINGRWRDSHDMDVSRLVEQQLGAQTYRTSMYGGIGRRICSSKW